MLGDQAAGREPGQHAGGDGDHAEPEPGHRPQYRRPRRVGQPSGREPGHAQHEHAGRQDEPGGAVRFVVALRAGGDREQGEAEAHHRHGGPVPRPQPGPEHRYRDQRGHRQVGRHRRLYQEDRYQSQCEELQPEPDHVQRQAGDERYLPGKPQQQARVHVGGVRSGAGGHRL